MSSLRELFFSLLKSCVSPCYIISYFKALIGFYGDVACMPKYEHVNNSKDRFCELRSL